MAACALPCCNLQSTRRRLQLASLDDYCVPKITIAPNSRGGPRGAEVALRTNKIKTIEPRLLCPELSFAAQRQDFLSDKLFHSLTSRARGHMEAELQRLRHENEFLRTRLAQVSASQPEPQHWTAADVDIDFQPRFEAGAHGLSSAQIARYSRQLLLPTFGAEGQH